MVYWIKGDTVPIAAAEANIIIPTVRTTAFVVASDLVLFLHFLKFMFMI
jgi:hypothetical protein